MESTAVEKSSTKNPLKEWRTGEEPHVADGGIKRLVEESRGNVAMPAGHEGENRGPWTEGSELNEVVKPIFEALKEKVESTQGVPDGVLLVFPTNVPDLKDQIKFNTFAIGESPVVDTQVARTLVSFSTGLKVSQPGEFSDRLDSAIKTYKADQALSKDGAQSDIIDGSEARVYKFQGMTAVYMSNDSDFWGKPNPLDAVLG